MSQSPYGAMWFATAAGVSELYIAQLERRNPLTGLCGLQRNQGGDAVVAIARRRNPLTGLCGLQHSLVRDHLAKVSGE